MAILTLLFGDGGERNDFRQACQKLRTEILPHHLHDLGGGRNIAPTATGAIEFTLSPAVADADIRYTTDRTA